jgi:hypothetical protein
MRTFITTMTMTLKHLTALLMAAGLAVSCGCASAEPLPVPPAAKLTWQAPASTPEPIAFYRPFFLTNTAPDFSLAAASTNWTRLPDTAATSVNITAVPAGSLLTVVSFGTNGVPSSNAPPVIYALGIPAMPESVKTQP